MTRAGTSLPRVVLSGIDTLEVFSRAPVVVEWQERLKEAAKWFGDGGKPVRQEVSGHVFLLGGRSRQAPYLLRSDAMAMHVNPFAVRGFPQVACELRSAFLWQHGGRGALERARHLMAVLTGFARIEPGVSRVDLAVDFQGMDFKLEDATRFRCRTRQVSPYLVDGRCTGFTFGAAKRAAGEGPAPILARLYNKTTEIRTRSPEKRWFYDLWARSPRWSEKEDVWRLEFQLRRKAFRSFAAAGIGRLDTWNDLETCAGALWRYLSARWLHLPGPRTERRWHTLDAAWERIHLDGFADPMWRGYDGDLTRTGRDELLRRQSVGFTGRLVSEVARAKVEDPSVSAEVAASLVVARAERVLAARGTTLEARAEERAQEHRQAARAILDAMPSRSVEAAPEPPRLAPQIPTHDATPAQPVLNLPWGSRGVGA